jgi:hypothetical protein
MAGKRRALKHQCQICGRPDSKAELVMAGLVRPVVADLIKKSFAEWDIEGFICLDDLNHYRN